MQISIEIRGGKETQRKVKRLGLSLHNFTTAMQMIGKEAADYYANEGFNSQGGVYGSAWAKLSPRTQKIKAILYPQYTNVPLVATGKMRDSFVSTSNANSAVISNKRDYYKYHQSTAPRSKLPRRQMAGINDPIKDMVRRILKDDIANKIKRA